MPIPIGMRGLKRNENEDARYDAHVWGDIPGGVVLKDNVPYFWPEADHHAPHVELKDGADIQLMTKSGWRTYKVQL